MNLNASLTVGLSFVLFDAEVMMWCCKPHLSVETSPEVCNPWKTSCDSILGESHNSSKSHFLREINSLSICLNLSHYFDYNCCTCPYLHTASLSGIRLTADIEKSASLVCSSSAKSKWVDCQLFQMLLSKNC